MNVVRKSFHVGEFFVRVNDTLSVAFTLPRVIDIDIDIAGISQAAAHHGIRLGAYHGVAYSVREMIPTVPTHGRSARQESRIRDRDTRDGAKDDAANQRRKESPLVLHASPAGGTSVCVCGGGKAINGRSRHHPASPSRHRDWDLARVFHRGREA